MKISDEGPLASFAIDRGRIARDVARHGSCLLLVLVPLVVTIALLFVDIARAAVASVFAMIAALLVLPLVLGVFRAALRDDLATRVELHRDGIRAWTRGGAVVIRWREIDHVTWIQTGDHWRSSRVYTADGARLTVTPWLHGGQTCAFLLRHGDEERGFPWSYVAAAEWAAPDNVHVRARGDVGVVEPARSGRSRCRSCGQLIAKGAPRFGRPMLTPRPGQTTMHWHHLDCAEAKMPDEVASARRDG